MSIDAEIGLARRMGNSFRWERLMQRAGRQADLCALGYHDLDASIARGSPMLQCVDQSCSARVHAGDAAKPCAADTWCMHCEACGLKVPAHWVERRLIYKQGDASDFNLGPIDEIEVHGADPFNCPTGLLHSLFLQNGAAWDIAWYRATGSMAFEVVARVSNVRAGQAAFAVQQNASRLSIAFRVGSAPEDRASPSLWLAGHTRNLIRRRSGLDGYLPDSTLRAMRPLS